MVHRPEHLRRREAELAAEGQAGVRLVQPEGAVPVECIPEAALAGGHGHEQVLVHHIVRLAGSVDFERVNLGRRVVNVAQRGVDGRHLGRVNGVAQQVAVGRAVPPDVGRLHVVLIDEVALDLQVDVRVFGQVLAGGRPVPIDLRRMAQRPFGDVARLAGDSVGVGADARVGVQRLLMAVGAGHGRRLHLGADRNAVTQNLVILAAVAIDTLKAQLAHVDVDAGVGIVEALIQIAVLDGVAAAAVEVAAAAVLARRPAHAARRGDEVNPFGRVARGAFAIGSSVGVAGQAIDVGLLSEVKAVVFPAVTGVTRCTARPVTLDADAEVVELVLLADSHQLIAAGQLHRLALPRPVGRLHHLLRGRLMTLQTDGRYLLPCGIGAGHERGVIGVGRSGLHIGPGVRRNRVARRSEQ